MDNNLLSNVDEVRKRVRVSYRQAWEALEKNDQDVLKTIIELEDKPLDNIVELSQRTLDRVRQEPYFILRRKGKTLVKAPAIAGAAAAVVGIMKPKILLLGIAGLILSGTDVALAYNDKEMSFNESFQKKSGEVTKSVQKRKADLELKYSEIKEAVFLKDIRDGGDKYYTVRL